MTMHVTNRGMFTLNPGMWNVPADIGAGLLAGAAIPAAIDTAAEIYVFNFVSDLLAATGVDEPTDGSYARVNPLTLGTSTEDDTNHRITFPASDISFGALDNEDIYALFVYVDGANDGARVLLGVDLFTGGVETANGAGFTYEVGAGGVDGSLFTFQHP